MKKLLLILILAFMKVNAQCWVQIDAGGYETLGIKDDGTLWGWGNNWNGQLGTTAQEYYGTPVQIGSDTNWAIVSIGNGHALAIKTDGTLWAWGRNDAGQIGNGEVTSNQNPQPVQIGSDNNWAAVSAGHVHSTAIKTNGTLWAWGCNYSGQLGNGVVDDINYEPQITFPVQIGTDANWKSVSASSLQNAAVKTDGTLWEWGHNIYLPMSNGDVMVSSPIQIGTDSDWHAVSVGGFAISAIKSDGTLWSWGHNSSGGVGNGTYTDVYTPAQISSEKWLSVNRGMNYFAGAVKEDGTLWTWGYNNFGVLGDGTITNRNIPILTASDVKDGGYQGGGDYSVALYNDGSMAAWGSNWTRQLGFSLDNNSILVPTQVVDACNTAGLKQLAVQNLTLYPNPVKDVLYIENTQGTTTDTITIADVTGKIITTQNNTLQIDVERLPAGMYFIKITTGKNVQQAKFIKQ